MALPKLDTPTYEVKLPSTGEPIKFRPFLVKEQKVLMMAQESKDTKQMINTMGELVKSCCFESIDIQQIPMFDIEYLFLNMRAKSVGEVISLNLLCEDDGKTRVPVEINIEDIHPQITDEHTNVIQLTESISLHLRYPLLKDQAMLMNESETDVQKVFGMLHQCIEEIRDGDTIYYKTDMTKKDLEQFVDQLSTNQFEDILEFFNSMPKLRHIVEIENPKTKVKNTIVLEGLSDFLV